MGKRRRVKGGERVRVGKAAGLWLGKGERLRVGKRWKGYEGWKNGKGGKK